MPIVAIQLWSSKEVCKLLDLDTGNS